MFISIFIVALLTNVVFAISKVKKVHFEYPVKLLPPITGTFFSTVLTRDQLTCFGNRDYQHPTYFMTLMCMLPFMPEEHCFAVWGSRSVIIESSGSIELLKLSTSLPHESMHGEFVPIDAIRWLEIPNVSNGAYHKEIFQIHAEPIYLCARSDDWKGGDAQFNITFRSAFLRDNDRRECHEKTLMHIGMIVALSSAWLLPYVAAMAVAVLTFLHGLQIVLGLFALSALVMCLAPLMLTRRNRYVARLYFNYFFTRISAEDTQSVLHSQLPAFQALFFSSALICGGSLFAYLLYYHGGVDREVRNTLLKGVLSVAVGWFVFFVCRSGERFFRDWLWLGMCVALAQMMDPHINPLSRDKVVVAAMVFSLLLLHILNRLRRTSAAESMERIASPPLRQLAGLFGIRMPNGHHHRHHHKTASPLRLETAADGVSSRSRGGSSAPFPKSAKVSTRSGHGLALWQRLSSSVDGPSAAPSSAADHIRLNVAALRGRGLLGPEGVGRDFELAAVDCRSAVGLVQTPLHALGPVSLGDDSQMFVPLLIADDRVLRPLQMCCAAMCELHGIIYTSVNAPSQSAISLSIQLQFADSSSAVSFVEQMSAPGTDLDALRASAGQPFGGELSVLPSLLGTAGMVLLNVEWLQTGFESSVFCVQGAVTRLLAVLCSKYVCTVDAAGLNRVFADIAAAAGGAQWMPSVSAETELSPDLLQRLGFPSCDSFLFVIDSANVLARNQYVNVVLSAVGAALGVSLSSFGGISVNLEPHKVVVGEGEEGRNSLLLRVTLSVLLTEEQCLVATSSSYLAAWNLLIGGVTNNGSVILSETANKALAAVVAVAVLSYHVAKDVDLTILELFRLQSLK